MTQLILQEEVCDQSKVEKICVTVTKNSHPAWSKTCNIPEPIKEEIHNEVLSQTSDAVEVNLQTHQFYVFMKCLILLLNFRKKRT